MVLFKRANFCFSIVTIALSYSDHSAPNLPSNVSDAQIDRRGVTLGQNFERKGLTDESQLTLWYQGETYGAVVFKRLFFNF